MGLHFRKASLPDRSDLFAAESAEGSSDASDNSLIDAMSMFLKEE